MKNPDRTTPSNDVERRVAVLGANGRLSRMVARAFHAAGWKVRAITRTGKSTPLEGLAGMEFMQADAMKKEDVIAATRGCDVIFNGLNPPYTDWAEKALPMAENVLAACRAHDAVHLFAGNVYNFGAQLPPILEPETPMHPDHPKAHIRQDMETLFQRAAQTDAIKTVILRAGDFFGGDGKGSWFDEAIISRLKSGRLVYPGRRDVVHAWAYLPDLAETFVRLAERADGLPVYAIFHFHGHNITGEVLHQAVQASMLKRLKPSALPGWLFAFLGLFNGKMREISEVFYLWQKPHALHDNRLAEIIGSVPHTPLELAVHQALVDQGVLKESHSTGSAGHEKTGAHAVVS